MGNGWSIRQLADGISNSGAGYENRTRGSSLARKCITTILTPPFVKLACRQAHFNQVALHVSCYTFQISGSIVRRRSARTDDMRGANGTAEICWHRCFDWSLRVVILSCRRRSGIFDNKFRYQFIYFGSDISGKRQYGKSDKKQQY